MTIPYMKIENFLLQSEHDELLAFAQGNQASFSNATVTTNVTNYRSSKVAHRFPLKDLIVSRVKRLLPVATDVLSIKVNAIGLIESQLTASGNGDFFKKHQDVGDLTNGRFGSYVYYFHTNAFDGGKLLLHHFADNTTKIIEPTDNSLVFFDSRTWHEVTPVRCNGWENSRFTVNGWFNHYQESDYQSAITIPG